MSAADIERARSILAFTDAAGLHALIEKVSCIEDSDTLAHEYDEMRTALRGYGMEDDVAVEVQQTNYFQYTGYDAGGGPAYG